MTSNSQAAKAAVDLQASAAGSEGGGTEGKRLYGNFSSSPQAAASELGVQVTAGASSQEASANLAEHPGGQEANRFLHQVARRTPQGFSASERVRQNSESLAA